MAPSKTALASKPARPISKYALPGTPKKRPSAPNKSILNFFQKVDRPEESMFVGGDVASPAVQPVYPAHAEDDIHGADDDGPAPESRYNEEQVPNKKRRLSSGGDQTQKAEPGPKKPLQPLPQNKTPNKASPPKKPRKGPFLDDSDSESDSEEEENQSPITTKALSGPEPKSLSSQDEEEQKVGFTTNNKTITIPTPADDAQPSRINLTHTLPPGPDVNTPLPRLKHEASTTGDYGEFGDLDDECDDDLWEGEERRAMRFMEEQARLEAEEETGIQNDSSIFETLEEEEEDAMTACCPICNSSFAGVSPDQATVHVNSCLDGNPTPLPSTSPPKPPLQPPKPKTISQEEDLVPAPEMGKRFARAAVARPGQTNPISIGGGGGPNSKGGPNSAFSKLMSGHAEDAAWSTAAAAETASRGKPAYQRTCPFYKIMPGFHICVDAFRYGAVEGCRAYFLSHFHSDHYIGLTASWTHGPIYCSKVTGSLVKSQLKTAEKYVVELEFEEKVPVPGTDGVFVTMIPANHCPGSSLFLFEKAVSSTNPNAHSKEKRLQRILHCGDFRACPAHIEHPQLKPETVDALGKIKQQKIDVCYLDTTYLNPRYSFPPQTDVIRACADLCFELDSTLRQENEAQWHNVLGRREGVGAGNNDTVSRFFVSAEKPQQTTDAADSIAKADSPLSHSPAAVPDDNALSVLGRQARANRNRLLVVCGTYSIGKERICKAIALALKTKIFASAAKIRMCSQLGDPELASLMTNKPYEAQVHMQMLMEIRAETLAEYLDQFRPHFGRVVGFRPSGWNYRPSLANNGGAGIGNGGSAFSATQVTASTPPGSVPTTQILHGPSWRTRFGPRDLVPQRGSSKEAMCFGVPYSEHSSFRELMLFIMSLRIEKVVPTVNVGSEPSRRRMKAWTDRWLSERRRGGVVRVVRENGDGGEDVLKDDGEAVVLEDSSSGDRDKQGQGKSMKKEEGKDEKKEAALWDGKDGLGGAVYW